MSGELYAGKKCGTPGGAGAVPLRMCGDNKDSRSSLYSTRSDCEDPAERHTWPNKREFVLSMVGYCVGLGNIWRFPYVCMKNGGGAFLVPFLISLIVCGMPVFFLETALGQFLGKSCLHTWSICPMLKGLGVSMNIISVLCSFYYSMILGWSLIYLVNSLKSPLPWTLCGQSWNTPDCITPHGFGNATAAAVAETMTMMTTYFGNGSSTTSNITSPSSSSEIVLLSNANETGVAGADVVGFNGSMLSENVTSSPDAAVSSTEEFWLRNVLELSPGLEHLDGIPWHTAAGLFAANALVLTGIVKGIRTSGKVVYVTATLPYLLLTVILILGLTLPGSGDGILYYIKPDFSKLMTLTPWMEASIQVFYSLGAGWGAILTMASYNKFNNNCMRDAIMLTFCCEGTSVYGGFAIFAILGHMAHKANVHISTFAKSGAGLAFVVYPEAISYLPLPQLWGVVFFLMLFLLGLDSMFSTVETSITVVADLWPVFVNKWRVLISSGAMLFIYLVGLLFAARGGMYWFQLCDWYIAAFALLIQASIECLVISWVYGVDRFSDDVELMIGRKPYTFFILAWKFVTPFILLILWVLTLAFYKPPTYEGYVYPAYAEVIGWIFAITPFLAVVYYAIKEPLKHSGTLKERVRKACTPTAEWMPSVPDLREKYQAMVYQRQDVPLQYKPSSAPSAC